jgi:MFS family permease
MGIILAVFPLVAAITSPIGGWFSDRYDQRDIRILAAGITTLSLLLLSRLTASSSIEFLMASLILLGVGVGLFSPANTSECLISLPSQKRSYVNGVLGMMRYAGQTLSYAISASVIGLYLPTQLFLEGGNIAAEQYVLGISQSLLFSAVLAAIAMLVAIVIRPRNNLPVEQKSM